MRRGGEPLRSPASQRVLREGLTLFVARDNLLNNKQAIRGAVAKEEPMDPLAALRPPRTIALPQGTLRYRDAGPDASGRVGDADRGPTLLFVHGIFAGGVLWRRVAPDLAGRWRCVVPDLPLGGHAHPLAPGADRSPRGMARLLADLIAALDLRDVVLVGNDTGGAICQLLVANHPGRIVGLVLTNCDAYEAFFPLPIEPFKWGSRLFGERFGNALARLLRWRRAQRALLWLVSRSRFDDATLDAYFGSFRRDPAVRADLIRFLAAVSNRDTLAAAEAFPMFRHPVLIAWGQGDVFFSARYARRLQRDFPDADLRFIPRARAFVPEDAPERLAELVAGFVADRIAPRQPETARVMAEAAA